MEDENVSFLRTRLPTPPTDLDDRRAGSIGPGIARRPQMPESRAPPPLRDARTGHIISRTDTTNIEGQRQVQRARALQQATDEDALRAAGSSHPAYAGWAPGSSDDEEEPYPLLSNNTQSSAQVYNEWSSRMRELRAARSTRGDISQLLGQVMETQHELDAYIRPTREARQALQAAARSRTHLPLPQYLLDRERNGDDNEDPEWRRSQRNHVRATMILEQRRRQQLLSEMQQRVSRAQGEPYRQRDTDTASSGVLLKPLEDTIKYLGSITTCTTEEEQIEAARDAGLLRHEYAREWNDFVFYPKSIQPPPESSWLKHGGKFAGTQRAAGAARLHLPYVAGGPRVETGSRRRMRAERMFQEELDRVNAYAAAHSSGTSLNSRHYPMQLVNAVNPGERIHDGEEWPVRVSIHGVDHSTMTLTGTMEASNVPDKSSPSLESSITTYLEGEIIDFNIHTLETKAFNANARIDGTYWRKLEPFRQLTDEQVVKNLLSRSWIDGVLMKNWVLMRWKGTQSPDTVECFLR